MSPAKKGLLVFLTVILLGAGLWLRIARNTKPDGPPPAAYEKLNTYQQQGVPDFEAIKTDGTTYRFSQLKGKIIILSFWATWCAPCVEEFPSMMRMLEKFQDDIVVVGVSADQNQKDVDEFVGMFGGQKIKNFVSLWDPSLRIAETYGTEKIPENYIIGRDFKLIKKLSSSEDWTAPQVTQYLETLIKNSNKN